MRKDLQYPTQATTEAPVSFSGPRWARGGGGRGGRGAWGGGWGGFQASKIRPKRGWRGQRGGGGWVPEFLVVFPALGNAKVLAFQFVYEPVFLGNAPRPVAFVGAAFERLRFASARERGAGAFLQQAVYFFQQFGVGALPVQVLRPRAGCPADGFIHGAASRVLRSARSPTAQWPLVPALGWRGCFPGVG